MGVWVIRPPLLIATSGERAWHGDADGYPGPQAFAHTRKGELRAAARILGLRRVRFLSQPHGEVGEADATDLVDTITRAIRFLRPDVVITHWPQGNPSYPDHALISHFTTTAVLRAADCNERITGNWGPYRVSKLYYLAASPERSARFAALSSDAATAVGNVVHGASTWERSTITTRIDTSAYVRQVQQALTCYQSQLPSYAGLAALPEAQQRELWGVNELFCASSQVIAGGEVEDDLFAGLRKRSAGE
ncbi:MAG: PIG-L family deacetylase [Chloroflexales bacterium]|nr:PIG-L family deacetylase [Chloroflexales bacterium]